MMNDLKYKIEGGAIVNRNTGRAIPDDEPVFVLRARDWLSLVTLREYVTLCEEDGCSQAHLQRVRAAIVQFMRWSRQHPELLKRPGEPAPTTGRTLEDGGNGRTKG